MAIDLKRKSINEFARFFRKLELKITVLFLETCVYSKKKISFP